MAPRSEQLKACAAWNDAEADRAYATARLEKNAAERLYLERRAWRLRAQAESLYHQAEDAWMDETPIKIAGSDCTNDHVAA